MGRASFEYMWSTTCSLRSYNHASIYSCLHINVFLSLTLGARAQRGLQYLVCHSVCLSGHAILAVRAIKKYNERYHRVKRQICGNIKMACFFPHKIVLFESYTYLGRGGHFYLILLAHMRIIHNYCTWSARVSTRAYNYNYAVAVCACIASNNSLTHWNHKER